MPLRIKLVVAVLGLALAVLIVAYLAVSPWLLWHLLPAAPNRVVLTSLRSVEGGTAPILSVFLPAAGREVVPEVSRLAWAGDETNSRLIIVPRLLEQRRVERDLREGGWQVRRIGPMLSATYGEGLGLNSWRQAVRAYVTSILSSRWPLTPAVILARDEVPPLSHGLAAVVTQRGKHTRVVVQPELSEPDAQRVGLPRVVPDAATIVVPGAVLSLLPQSVHEELNAQIRRAWGLQLTRPDILGELRIYEQVSLSFKDAGEDVAQATLVVRGDGVAFAETVTTWAQEEERRGRLTTRAFRLPDGTLGYEKVPGEPAAVFVQESGPCRPPLAGKTRLWLCRTGNTVSVGTVQGAVESAGAELPEAESHIALGAGAVERLRAAQACSGDTGTLRGALWCGLESLRLRGSEENISAEFVVR